MDELKTSQNISIKDPTLAPGSRFVDRYEIVKILGRGGMSIVYQARDVEIDRLVALKFLLHAGADGTHLSRFEREARALAALSHENVVKVFAHGVGPNNEPYMVLEFVEGRTLAELLAEKGKLDPESAVSVLAQIGAALQHAHDSNILHRDLKPSNVLLCSEQDVLVAKVSDFGLAKLLDDASGRITRTGQIFGSPPYMSPEQVLGMEADGRSDLYSLGCILYELLSGQPPFQSDNLMELLVAHTNREPEPLSSIVSVPSDLEKIAHKLLMKIPDQRFESASQVVSALKEADLSHIAQRKKPPKRGRLLAIAAVVVVALVVSPIVLGLVQSSPSVPAMGGRNQRSAEITALINKMKNRSLEAASSIAKEEDHRLGTKVASSVAIQDYETKRQAAHLAQGLYPHRDEHKVVLLINAGHCERTAWNNMAAADLYEQAFAIAKETRGDIAAIVNPHGKQHMIVSLYNCYRDAGNYEKAADHIEHFTREGFEGPIVPSAEDPLKMQDSRAIWQLLATQTMLDAGRIDQAEVHYQKFQQYAETDAWRNLGRLLAARLALARRNVALAQSELNAYKQDQSPANRASFQIITAELLAQQDKWFEADRAFQKALDELRLSRTHIQNLNDYAKYMESLSRAINICQTWEKITRAESRAREHAVAASKLHELNAEQSNVSIATFKPLEDIEAVKAELEAAKKAMN